MKTMIILLLAASNFILLAEKSGFATSAMESAADTTKKTKDQIVKEMEENLSKLQGNIDELKAKTKNSKNKVAEDVSSQLANFEKDQKELRRRLHEIKKDTGAAWGQMRKSFDEAFSRLKDGVKKAKEEFKN